MDKYFIVLLCLLVFYCEGSRSPIKLVNNGYQGITIAVGRDVEESEQLIQEIKDVFTKASAVLFRATKYRAYFSQVTILLPVTWSKRGLPAPSGLQSFERANVLVDVPNRVAGDRPYTHQVAGCGKSGEFIHLTPGYLFKKDESEYAYGVREKAVVHEWGHLRWGLFDEYPLEGERRFYRYRDQILPVQCTAGLKGLIRNWKTYDECILDEDSLELEPDCRFFPFSENTLTGSLMSYQYLPSVIDFCGEEEVSSMHNLHAPSAQNRKCNSLTSWGVLREHEDFVNDRNSPIDVGTDTTPSFTLVQEREQKISLILDVSNSMKNDGRLQKMNQAARNYIFTALTDGTYLGMLEFAGDAEELAPLTLIDTESTRQTLIDKLPQNMKPWTSIGAGLQAAIDQLSANGNDPAGQRIVLITDGEETKDPLISDVAPRLKELGIVVDTVGISEEASRSLSGLSADTGGKNYFYSARDDDTSLDEALVVSASRGLNASLLVHSAVATGAESDIGFQLDSSLGRKTVITINGLVEKVRLISPGNEDVIASGRVNVVQDTSTASQQIFINGEAETGEWRIMFETTRGVPRVMIQSKPKTGDDVIAPVTLRSWTDRPKFNFTAESYVIVYAEVRQGYLPVSGARVVAEIPSHSGTHQVFLKDSGVYPDLNRGDGVYSAAILAKTLTADGRYPVRVRMSSTADSLIHSSKPGAMVAPVLRNGEVVKDVEPMEPVKLENVMRTTSAGVLELSQYDVSLTLKDVIPPSRVENLDLVRVFVNNRSAVIHWTEPGDDFNIGKVDRYEFRMSEEFEKLHQSFNTTQNITNLLTSIWTTSSEGDSGNQDVRAIIDLSKYDYSMFYIAFKSMDEAQNSEKPSNIIGLSFDKPEMSFLGSPSSNDPTPTIVGVLMLLIMLILLLILAYKYREVLREKFNGLRTKVSPSPTPQNDVV